jgi:hypothetical protein
MERTLSVTSALKTICTEETQLYRRLTHRCCRRARAINSGMSFAW